MAADVILTDHLAPQDLAADAGERGAEVIDVSKLPYQKSVAQEEINRLIVEHARKGKKVVRLKGGDPFVFGRGFEEAEYCAGAGIPCRVIPGVTSATAAPAAAGLSITHRGLVHDVTIVSGHVPPGHPKSLVDWGAVARMTGTIVLLMAVKNAPAIAATLEKEGKSPDTPVAIVESASTAAQRLTTMTLGEVGDRLDQYGVTPPAIIVIGPAAEHIMQDD